MIVRKVKLFQTPYGDSTSKLFAPHLNKDKGDKYLFQTPYGDSTSKPLFIQFDKILDKVVFQTPYGDSTSKQP